MNLTTRFYNRVPVVGESVGEAGDGCIFTDEVGDKKGLDRESVMRMRRVI